MVHNLNCGYCQHPEICFGGWVYVDLLLICWSEGLVIFAQKLCSEIIEICLIFLISLGQKTLTQPDQFPSLVPVHRYCFHWCLGFCIHAHIFWILVAWVGLLASVPVQFTAWGRLSEKWPAMNWFIKVKHSVVRVCLRLSSITSDLQLLQSTV